MTGPFVSKSYSPYRISLGIEQGEIRRDCARLKGALNYATRSQFFCRVIHDLQCRRGDAFVAVKVADFVEFLKL